MLDTIAWYTPILITASVLIVGWLFSDWINWRKYYPTILFIIMINLVSYVLTYDYPLWLYHESLFCPNRMINEIRLNFLFFPPLILFYLTFHPYSSSMLRQLTFIIVLVVFSTLIESLYVFLDIISYHNGWNIWWTAILWLIMFHVMAIHYKKPMWAWLICMIFATFVILYFNIPLF